MRTIFEELEYQGRSGYGGEPEDVDDLYDRDDPECADEGES